MKLKDVSFFQQHVEKFVLVGAAVFALLVASYFLLGSPYNVDVPGEAGSLSPAEIEESILTSTDQLKTRLEGSQAGEGSFDVTVPAYARDFQQRWDRALLPVGQFAGTFNMPGLEEGLIIDGRPDLPDYYVPRPPVAQRFIARAGTGMVDFTNLAAHHDAFIELIGDSIPADIRYVSVGTEFDFDAWIERLMAEPSSDEYRPLRRGWVLPTAAITGVYLQRQRLDPETGQFGETTIIQPLPNQVAFLGTETYPWDPESAKNAVEFIRQNQEQIARPEFVPMAVENIWMAPDTPALTPQQQAELNRINRDIRSTQTRITNLERQLGLNQAVGQRANRPGQQRGGGQFVDINDFAPEVVRPAPRPAAGSGNQDLNQHLQTARTQLQDLLVKRNNIWGLPEDVLSTRGRTTDPYMMNQYDPAYDEYSENPSGMGTTQNWQPPVPRGARFQPQVNPRSAAAATPERRLIRVWAHDLTVEPGQTYRYRVVVTAYNPLFQMARVSNSQREQFFHRLALAPDEQELAAAPWSKPVSVDPLHHFFLVGGSTRQQQAQVEVWQLFRGKWRAREFTAQPGDPLGGVATISTAEGDVELDMRLDSLLVDLVDVGGDGGRFAVGGTTRMIYLNRDTNRMTDRDVSTDRNHPDRIRLQNEAAMVDALALQP